MKNFTRELKNIMTEDPGVPIMSPDELRARSQTIVILTNSAPDELLALAGPDRKATLLSVDPPMITLPYQKGVFKVRPEDIVFENHHTGRDVTEAGAEETPYEKFFASAMKKFGVSSPIELSPDETKKFFNYVDKNWEAEEETDEDTTEDVTTGKVGKKDKGSYQHAYKLALKKYQIHSADELDTPEERKGFTDYVDRLWKKGDIHRDKKEASIDTDITEAPKSRAQRDRERIKKQKQQQTKQKKNKQMAAQRMAAQAKQSEERKREAEAARKTAAQKQEPEKSDTPTVTKSVPDKAEPQTQDREREKEDREREQQQKEREQDQAAREREKEQKAKEKDDDKDKDKKKGNGVGSFIKQAAGAATKAVKQQTKQYEDTVDDGWLYPEVKRVGKKQVRSEVSPPDRKFQVKGIKKHMKQKKGKDKIPKTYVDKKTGKRKKTNPWALAWAQYDKYGVPSRIEKD